MFESLESLPATRAVAVAHQVVAIVRHLKPLARPEREKLARVRAEVVQEPETNLALAVVDEIERLEGASLADLAPEVVDRYLAELSDLAMERTRREFRLDPQRGRERLREMRRAASF